jgi:hypothetical protein
MPVAFTVSVPTATIGTAWSWLTLVRARRRRDSGAETRAMKWVLLSSSCLASLIVVELVVRIVDEWSYRIPEPRLQFAKSPGRPEPPPVLCTERLRDRDDAAKPGQNDAENG